MRKSVVEKLSLFKYVATGIPNKNLDLETTIKYNKNAERLSPLIYLNSVASRDFTILSKSSQLKLRQQSFAVVADVELKKNAIQELVALLKNTNTKVLLLKGMAFNELIYPSDAPRGTSDIDLLVQEQHKHAFTRQFKALATKVEKETNDAFDELFEETWHFNARKKVYFDLHWHLSYPNLFNFDSQQIFERSLVHPYYQSEQVRVLSHEDHLVYLAIHLVKDCDFYDYGLLDCHELISQYKPDLEKCAEIAKPLGAETSLYFLFFLTYQQLGTSICPVLLNKIKPNIVKRLLCLAVINVLFTKQSKLKSKLHRSKQFLSLILFSSNLVVIVKHILSYLMKTLK